ncbi:MAG TPA: NAD-dependent epimerase/dehydratase family protein [Sphingobacteriaceae bacterium]
MILVTGATGFLGSEVVRQLRMQNKSVIALKRAQSAIPTILQSLDISWRNADLLNYFDLEEAMEGITQVYHCAALISFDPAEKKAMIRANREGTANITHLCLERGIRLLHVSSVAAVGEAKNGSPITEKDHWQFSHRQTGYAISKYESEMEVWRAVAEGLDAVIVNPSIIIGPNAGKSGSGRLFEQVQMGLKFYPKGGCGLTDVEDVAAIMIRLMESGITGERFILNAENWSYKDLFSEIAHALEVKPPKILAPEWLLRIAAGAGSILSFIQNKRFGLTSETARSASRLPVYSSEKIRKTIGAEFKPIKQSIRQICQNLKP